MTTPHPHAEVLRAIADGKEVECKLPNAHDWVNTVGYRFCNPLSEPTRCRYIPRCRAKRCSHFYFK